MTKLMKNKTPKIKKAKQVLAFRIDPRLKRGSEIYKLFFRDKEIGKDDIDKDIKLPKNWLHKKTFTSNELIKRLLFSYTPENINDEYSFIKEMRTYYNRKQKSDENSISIAPRMVLEGYKKNLFAFFNGNWFQNMMTKIQKRNIDFDYPLDSTLFTLNSRHTESFITEWFINDIRFLINRTLPVSEQDPTIYPVLRQAKHIYNKESESIKLARLQYEVLNETFDIFKISQIQHFGFKLKEGISTYQTKFLLDLIGLNDFLLYTPRGQPFYVLLLRDLIQYIYITNHITQLLKKLQEYLFSLIPDAFFQYHFNTYVQPELSRFEPVYFYAILDENTINVFKSYILKIIDQTSYWYTLIVIDIIFFHKKYIYISVANVQNEIISDIVKEVIVISLFFNLLIETVLVYNVDKFSKTFDRTSINYVTLFNDSEVSSKRYKPFILHLPVMYSLPKEDDEMLRRYDIYRWNRSLEYEIVKRTLKWKNRIRNNKKKFEMEKNRIRNNKKKFKMEEDRIRIEVPIVQ